jgi:hypothetical protein
VSGITPEPPVAKRQRTSETSMTLETAASAMISSDSSPVEFNFNDLFALEAKHIGTRIHVQGMITSSWFVLALRVQL